MVIRGATIPLGQEPPAMFILQRGLGPASAATLLTEHNSALQKARQAGLAFQNAISIP